MEIKLKLDPKHKEAIYGLKRSVAFIYKVAITIVKTEYIERVYVSKIRIPDDTQADAIKQYCQGFINGIGLVTK